MGSPLVRRDELDAAAKKLNTKMNRIKREIRDEVIEYLESLGLTGPASEPAGELDATASAELPGADVAELAADPEGVALVEAIHERKEASEEADGALFKDES